MKTIVTIGVCVRNCEKTIKEVIESILRQNFPHECMEVICVDDGSEDNTLSIILNFTSKTDMPFKVFHDEWKGLGWARNVVANNAQGKYIIWVDGDMVLSDDFVRKQVTFMEKNPMVGIAKGKYGLLLETNLVADLETLYFVLSDLKFKEGDDLPIGYCGTGGSIYRLEALKQAGFFDPSIKGAGEDMDVELRIKLRGWSISKTGALFFERRRKTWRDLWKEYFWQGLGARQFSCKHNLVTTSLKMIPPIAVFAQIANSLIAYRFTRKKYTFLMPLHYIFKRFAWLLGYLKGSLELHTF